MKRKSLKGFQALAISSLTLLLCSICRFPDPGIRVKQAKEHTTVYEIRIQYLESNLKARGLDGLLISKTGILSSNTDFSSRVCTVEVSHEVKPEHLRMLVQSAGLEISKTFD